MTTKKKTTKQAREQNSEARAAAAEREVQRLREEARLARMTVHERFDHMHGECVEHGGALYYADGSTRDVHPHGPLVHAENIRDPAIRAANVLAFHRVRYERAVHAFEKRKRQLTERAMAALNVSNGCPLPAQSAEEAKADLVALRDEARALRRTYEEAKQANGSPEPEWRQVQREQDADNMVRHSRVLNAISKVNL